VSSVSRVESYTVRVLLDDPVEGEGGDDVRITAPTVFRTSLN
jgi:hypothetical protein